VTPSTLPTLTLEHVSRHLAGRRVLHDLDLAITRGDVLGLLGVNGAGKTTTLRIIAGVLAPSSGSVRFEGRDLHEYPALARRGIGYLPETPPLHAELTAVEFLRFCARLHGLARSEVSAAVARALERCELGAVRHRPLATLSKGFRQRVGLAQAILHDPQLIVLDEPASGLDPVQALKLREIVRGLGKEHAVVLSTHVLPDVLACCDRVAILHRGELRHVGALGAATSTGALRVALARSLGADDWRGIPGVVAAEAIDATHWRVRLAPGSAISMFSSALVERGFGLEELRAEGNPLEQIFMAIAADDVPDRAA
jgi:ABC-2 type transport system ATP-binding protein